LFSALADITDADLAGEGVDKNGVLDRAGGWDVSDPTEKAIRAT
jgi:hypothetical protein